MILLDTCVVSELAKSAPAPAVLTWFEGVRDEDLRLSVLTLGEIRQGVELLEVGPRRARIEAWLSELQETFAERILPIDREVALEWGKICARAKLARRHGRRWTASWLRLRSATGCAW